MKSIELASNIVKILDSKKADNVELIKIRDLTIITDYFVIASANNTTHVKALVDELEHKINEDFSIKPTREDGYSGASWVILDYGDVIVHVFYEETRQHYNLEKLWADGERVDISTIIG